MAKPTAEQMATFMRMVEAKGLLIFTFDPMTFHVTTIAQNTGLQQELERIGDQMAALMNHSLQQKAAEDAAKRFKFDPERDPNYRKWQ